MSYFYVISPVGADLDFPAKKAILKSLGRSFGCMPIFPLDRRLVFSMEAARLELQRADFILADLSLERPSCYFELGLAQALGVLSVVIAKAGTRIHQVASPSRILWYSDMVDYRSLIFQSLKQLGYKLIPTTRSDRAAKPVT